MTTPSIKADTGFECTNGTGYVKTDVLKLRNGTEWITQTSITGIGYGNGTTWSAATAAQVRTALGVSTLSGSNTGDQDLSSYATTAAVASGYQPLNSDLTAIGALTTNAFGRGILETNTLAEAQGYIDLAPTDSVVFTGLTVGRTGTSGSVALWDDVALGNRTIGVVSQRVQFSSGTTVVGTSQANSFDSREYDVSLQAINDNGYFLLDKAGATYKALYVGAVTANAAITLHSTGIIAGAATVSATEVGYLDGVTSAIQTQIDAKLATATAASTYLPLAGGTLTGAITGTSNVIEQRNSTNAQTLRVYGSYTSDSVYSRASFSCSTTALTLAFQSDTGNGNIVLTPKGTGTVSTTIINCTGINASNNDTWIGFSDGYNYISNVTSFRSSGVAGITINPATKNMIVASTGYIAWCDNVASNAGSVDVTVVRDSASVLALRTGNTPQSFRVYGAYTDSVNYVRASLSASTTSITLAAETAGTGADDIDLILNPAGTGAVRFGTHSALAAETVTGYITIKDAGGTSRKLAVVS